MGWGDVLYKGYMGEYLEIVRVWYNKELKEVWCVWKVECKR